jgi:hypothetical protein
MSAGLRGVASYSRAHDPQSARAQLGDGLRCVRVNSLRSGKHRFGARRHSGRAPAYNEAGTRRGSFGEDF